MAAEALLSIEGLVIHYELDNEVVEAVNNVSLTVAEGETLGLVGETGAGKTTIARGIMRLVPDPPGRIVGGRIVFQGEDLLKKSEVQMRRIRGNKISMIFQDPMTVLNPVMTVGSQVAEAVRTHEKCSKTQAEARARAMLETVGIKADRYNDYPHEFSGGMKQRVVIATALACNPKLLIADEPTTALDVTIQAQVLNTIRMLQNERDTAMLLITHDLGVVAETCDSVAVIYAGQIVEYGSVDQVFTAPGHPYTRGLFNSLPSVTSDAPRLKPIKGLMPNPSALPEYCSFFDRCDLCRDGCKAGEPPRTEVEPGHYVCCWAAL